MQGHYFTDAGIFLVDTILGFYILIVLLRLLFHLTRADFYNPISQFIFKISNPPVSRLRRIVPRFWGVDFASIVLLVALEAVRITITTLLFGGIPQLAGVFILSIAELLKLTVYILVFSIFVRAVLSWVSTGRYHPMQKLLHSFTEPLLASVRRFISPTAGFDLSPIIVFLILMLFLKILVQPLLDLGRLLLY
jgi:YggT family protein